MAAQGPLYTCDLTAWRHPRAAGGDVLIVTGVVLDARRLGGVGPSFWFVLVSVSAAAAVAIELVALETGYWGYTPAMPALGPIGLSPAAQLPVAAVIATLAARRPTDVSLGSQQQWEEGHDPSG